MKKNAPYPLIKKRQHVDIGQMNQRVAIQERADVRGPDGGISAVNWVTRSTVWAKIVNRTGNQDAVIAGHIQTQSLIEIETRRQLWLDSIPPDITNKYRAVFSNRAYKIKGINRVNNQSNYVTITCDGNEWESV